MHADFARKSPLANFDCIVSDVTFEPNVPIGSITFRIDKTKSSLAPFLRILRASCMPRSFGMQARLCASSLSA